ncbi:MAG: DUF2330 domain-containing protein, partial [Phycisphaerales bacterium]
MAEHRIMTARQSLLATVCVSIVMCVGAAFGDGGMFFRRATPKYANVYQPTQKVYIRWDGSQEKLLIQTKYEGPAEEMVWIVPVPAEPTVETGDQGVFERLSEKTDWRPDIVHTDFVGLWPKSFGIDRPVSTVTSSGGGTSVVQWRRRIGDYDVVLLRPVSGEDVIAWLNTNDFAIPEAINPILEDYVADGWWMVVSKIHPDALSDITSEKLANGTLNPLDMTFQSSACLYPMRLTSMAAGPVEELIYIEGPAHYQPLTLSDGDWQIDIFGGLIRQVPQHDYRSDIELALETREGRDQTKFQPRLTKLRRVFLPEEMTEDLVFTPMDYSEWLESGDPLLIGQAATQYGRSRDPNGVSHLLKAMSSGLLEQVQPTTGQYQSGWISPSAKILTYDSFIYDWTGYWVVNWHEPSEKLVPISDHVLSVIWALGEIAVEHGANRGEVEQLLLQCAKHDNQLVRMEAYVALTKLDSTRLGPILVDRLAYIPESGPSARNSYDLKLMAAEMNMATDWIVRLGTAEQKDALANALIAPVTKIFHTTEYSHVDPEQPTPTYYDWSEWVIWQAAGAQRASLITPLQGVRARFESTGKPDSVLQFLLRAEAASDSGDAGRAVVNQIVADEARVLTEGQGPTPEGMTSLGSFYELSSTTPKSLRVRILWRYWLRYNLYPMPSEVSDVVFRSALSQGEFNDWYTLYLLAGIRSPQIADRERLLRVWDQGDPFLRLVVVDVLYVWGDTETLIILHEEAQSDDVKSEIVWALAGLGATKAIDLVEERVRGSWNTDWANCGRPFLIRTWDDTGVGDVNFTEALRKADATQTYFHPESEDLDAQQLAALKRLCDDSTIHPGLRVGLLTTDYDETDWGRALLTKAVKDLLEANPTSSTVTTLGSKLTSELVVDACGQSSSDEFRRSLMLSLLAGGKGYHLPIIKGLLQE